MSVSDIAVTALTAVATVNGNQLTITTSDPRSGALPNIALDHVDIYASQTDTFASATVKTQGTLRALHADAGEEQTWYYWGIPYDKLGAAGTRYPSGATGGVACTSLGRSGLLFGGLSNGKIVASVGSNALTVAVKSAAGNDPGTSDPNIIFTALPNATVSNGSYQVRQITAALSLVISSGSTLDAANNAPFRLWVLLIDDGGTLRLGIIKCTDVNRYVIYPISGSIISATSEGGAGAADSSGVVYANATVTSKPFRIIGYLEWSSGLAAVGTWDVAPDIIRMHGLGDKKPGDIVQQTIIRDSSTTASNTTTIPDDNTIPQSTEGSAMAFFDIAMAATSKVNLIDYDAQISVSHHTGNCHMIGAMFIDAAAGASVADSCKIPAADDIGRLFLNRRVIPSDTSSHTYKIRVGGGAAGTWTVNGVNGGTWLGAVLSTTASARELMT
jgi:hypothetical protein